MNQPLRLSPARRRAADNIATPPLGIAVIGCGAWGLNHVRTFAELGALAAVADEDIERARETGEANAVPALPVDQILNHPSIDCVVVATSAASHASLAMEALTAGKDVLLEKPFARTVEEAEALALEARRCGRILMAGHLLHYHPAFEALSALVQAGRLGSLRYAVSSRMSLGRLRIDEDVFQSFGPHDVSMLLALFGRPPTKVRASGRAFITPTVADEAHAELSFPEGRRALIQTSWLSPIKEQRLVLVGDRASAVFDDVKPWPEKLSLRDYRVRSGTAGPGLEGDPPSFVPLTPEAPLKRECAHFMSCCRDRCAPRTDAVEALRVQRVLVAVSRQISLSLEESRGSFDDESLAGLMRESGFAESMSTGTAEP